MNWFRQRRAVLVAIPATLLLAAHSEAQLLLRDDFRSPTLDETKWIVPTGPKSSAGRTQIRPPAAKLDIIDDSIQLRLDTHNPSAQTLGESFLGSEIGTVDHYDLAAGLIVEARMRFVGPLPGGLVGSFFTFGQAGGVRDEIDFELSSNDLVAGKQRVLTNVFDNDDFDAPGIQGHEEVPGLDLDGFHVYRIEWFEGRVTWSIDAKLVRKETATVPDDPQNVRLRFWVPDTSFTAAYNEGLVPASAAEDNETYLLEIDWVKIRRPLPLLSRLRPWIGPLLVGLVSLVLAAIALRRIRSR